MNVVTWMKTVENVGSSKWLWDAQSTDISQHALMSPIFFIDKQDVVTYILSPPHQCHSEDQGNMWVVGSCGSLAQIPTMAFSVASESTRWMKLWNLRHSTRWSCCWCVSMATVWPGRHSGCDVCLMLSYHSLLWWAGTLPLSARGTTCPATQLTTTSEPSQMDIGWRTDQNAAVKVAVMCWSYRITASFDELLSGVLLQSSVTSIYEDTHCVCVFIVVFIVYLLWYLLCIYCVFIVTL